MPKKTKKQLFGVNFDDLRWGIAPGEHVCHIYTVDTKNMSEVSYQDIEKPGPGFEGVKQQEMYSNKGDNATAIIFMDLAKKIAKDYEDDTLCGDPKYGDEYSKLLESFKTYLTAGRRSTQQKALSDLRKKLDAFQRKVSNDYAEEYPVEIEDLDGEKPKRVATVLSRLEETLRGFENTLNTLNRGNQAIKKGTLPDPLEEPDNTISGKAAVWVKTNDELFPHEPSPNDIKQGYGLEDCYMLSAMAIKAAKDPQFIKDMMKDNGDGTVTVRFYTQGEDEEGKTIKEPVYINVIKSVNKGPVGNNVYAAGSLWVQMLEKAYATYQTLTSERVITGFSSNSPTKTTKGMKSIDRGTTDGFLNAIDSSNTLYTGSGRVEITGMMSDMYKFDDNGKPLYGYDRKTKGYTSFEKDLFALFDKHVNQQNEVFTVGSSEGKGLGNLLNSNQGSFLKKHGIRTNHAYGVMKVFEKDGTKFVQLRDPYATFKAEYGKDGKLKQNSYGPLAGGGSMVEGMRTAGLDDMGTFNLELSDFLTYFKQFSGIKSSIVSELSLIARGKTTQLQNEMKELVNEDAVKEENAAVDKLSAEEQRLYHELTDNPTSLKNAISQSASELKVTDEFFTWPNSSEFNKMRNQTYELNKTLGKYNEEKATLKEKIGIVKAFAKLNTLADNYQTKKTKDLKNILDSGKKPSPRFVHRLTAAMNIRRCYAGQEKLKEWPKKGAEQMGIIMNDIIEKTNKINQGDLPETTKKEIIRMQEVVDIIGRTIKNNPKLAADSKIDVKAVDNAKADLSGFENLDMDDFKKLKETGKNNGKINNGNEANAEKGSFLADFDML